MGCVTPLLTMTLKHPDYQCPICQTSLTLKDKVFCCGNNHSFDLAKEGYVNLLPVQLKQSKQPGDNKAMVNARRAFLEKGYYQPLVSKLASMLAQYKKDQGNILDAGCGEGYYTHQLAQTKANIYGVDIAKEAIKKAAKKYKDNHFCVATLSHLPFADQTFNALVSVYAPILEAEFTRVLTFDGILITVTPAKNHLHALKEKIYINAQQHDENKSPIAHLTLLHQEQLSYEMELSSGDDILNLLSMTPFAFKASEQVKKELAQLEQFNCQADFMIRTYQKSR